MIFVACQDPQSYSYTVPHPIHGKALFSEHVALKF